MNRRSFLMKLGAGMIGALVVRPSFIEPKWIWDTIRFDVYDLDFISETDIIKVELDKIVKKIPSLFERDDLFYSTMKRNARP